MEGNSIVSHRTMSPLRLGLKRDGEAVLPTLSNPLTTPHTPAQLSPIPLLPLSKPFTNSHTPSQPSPKPLQPLTLLPNPLQAIPVLKTQYPAPCTKLHVSQSLVYREGIWISLLPPSPLIAHSNPSRLLEIPQRPPSL